MTKQERRKQQLETHYQSLTNLLRLCGSTLDGKKVSSKLLRIENDAHRSATYYCNGETFFKKPYQSEDFDMDSKTYVAAVQSLFNGKLKGLFVNGDARGYALKIEDKVMQSDYKDTGLWKDWGGSGILAPEITGN